MFYDEDGFEVLEHEVSAEVWMLHCQAKRDAELDDETFLPEEE